MDANENVDCSRIYQAGMDGMREEERNHRFDMVNQTITSTPKSFLWLQTTTLSKLHVESKSLE